MLYHLHTGIRFTSEPSNVEVCERDTAIFYCQYEGSLASPTWNINSMAYTPVDLLPPNHFYHPSDGTLSVSNITPNQNNTQYQCQLLSLSDGQLCAYRSTIGRLIIKCRNHQNSVIPNSGKPLFEVIMTCNVIFLIRHYGYLFHRIWNY